LEKLACDAGQGFQQELQLPLAIEPGGHRGDTSV
jgi:hypothetical protein